MFRNSMLNINRFTYMDKELLKALYGIHSPSGCESKMKRFIKRYIKKNIAGAEVRSDKTGNLYVTKGEADTYPCVVAHLDQVQDTHSDDFDLLELEGGIVMGYSPGRMQLEGLGADDKNGVWIALMCLKEFDIIKAAFFVQEEVGCVGSENADMEFFDDCRFVLQADRREGGDIINVASGTELCSQEFLDATGYMNFGYTPAEGMLTDVMTLKERGLNVSCINVSCGYYDPHTDRETTVLPELYRCLDFFRHIINRCTSVYPHECSMGFDRYAYDFNEEYDWAYETAYSMIEDLSSALDLNDFTMDEIASGSTSFMDGTTCRAAFEDAYQDFMETHGKQTE